MWHLPPDRSARLAERSDLSSSLRLLQERAKSQLFLDLFGEDSWRNVYAGELEVRPPAAPTTGPDMAAVPTG
jgi:hypothetical protein